MTRILVVERDEFSRRCLRDGLVRGGFEVVEALALDDVRQNGIGRIEAAVVNVALLAEAGDLIARAAPVPVVLVADSPSIAHAVDCMRLGAADYLPRPLQPRALVATVERAVARARPALDRIAEFSPLLGTSPTMRALFDRIAKTAPTDSPVLIQGESGTGKEVVARALHAASHRRWAKMIALRCTAVPDALLTTELFGHEADALGHPATPLWGAGTPHRGLIEAADGGTLLLDDIDHLPPAAQTRLLRLLQDDGVARRGSEAQRLDVRLIASTRHDLDALAARGHFHKELRQRLNATLRIPPLRHRVEDVVAIAHTVLERAATRLDKPGLSFSAAAIDAMRRYPWPGNARQLSNAVECAAMRCRGTTIAAGLLALGPVSVPPTDAVPPSGGGRETSGSLEDFFVRFVLENQDQHTETELASKLGISRKSLWERRQRLNIPRRRTRKRGARRDQR